MDSHTRCLPLRINAIFHNSSLARLCLLITLSFSSELYADCRSWDPRELRSAPVIIGNIIIDNKDVFDTSNKDESTWLHKTANYIHIETKEAVIKRQLLFKQGDVYNPLLIDETERLLRGNRYIKSAQIVPTRICDDGIELYVKTTDSWSLTPGISFGRSGGVNTTSIEFEEQNVFGYGKELSLDSRSDSERSQNILLYNDNNLFGSRYVLSAEYQDNSDGSAYRISTGLPFYQLSSEQAWNVSLSSSTRENAIYEQGVITDSIGKQNKSLNAFYAWAYPSNGISVNRYKIGWSYSEETSFVTEKSPTLQLPADKIYSSPYIGWQYLEQKYIKRTDLYGVGVDVTEDISLGDNIKAQLGWINKKWGSTDNLLSLSTSYSRGFQPNNNQLLLLKLNFDGLLDNSTITDGIIKARSDWLLFRSNRSRLHIFGSIEAGSHLSTDNQITLGGDSGLRGYPLKYQNGDRKFLISVEQRYFFDWYPLRLVKSGISAFADIGSAWDSNNGTRRTLRDVGFGFLFASTRQSRNKVVRIDFAFPLNDNDTVDSFQILIGTEKNF